MTSAEEAQDLLERAGSLGDHGVDTRTLVFACQVSKGTVHSAGPRSCTRPYRDQGRFTMLTLNDLLTRSASVCTACFTGGGFNAEGMSGNLSDLLSTLLNNVKLIEDFLDPARTVTELIERADLMRFIRAHPTLGELLVTRIDAGLEMMLERIASDEGLEYFTELALEVLYPLPDPASSLERDVITELAELVEAKRRVARRSARWVVARMDDRALTNEHYQNLLETRSAMDHSGLVVAPVVVFEALRSTFSVRDHVVLHERPTPALVETLVALHDEDSSSAYAQLSDALAAAETLV